MSHKTGYVTGGLVSLEWHDGTWKTIAELELDIGPSTPAYYRVPISGAETSEGLSPYSSYRIRIPPVADGRYRVREDLDGPKLPMLTLYAYLTVR